MGEDLSEKVGAAIGPLLQGLKLEQVEVGVSGGGGRLLVRIAVDKEEGVTIDDCARASDLIGKVLDRDDVMPGPYQLEVMSPGLFRPLNRPPEFKRSIGKRVRVRMRRPFEGEGGYSGILRSADEQGFVLETGDDSIELRYEAVSGVRLDPEMPW